MGPCEQMLSWAQQKHSAVVILELKVTLQIHPCGRRRRALCEGARQLPWPLNCMRNNVMHALVSIMVVGLVSSIATIVALTLVPSRHLYDTFYDSAIPSRKVTVSFKSKRKSDGPRGGAAAGRRIWAVLAFFLAVAGGTAASLGAGVPSAGVPGAVDTMLGMDGAATHLAGVRGAGMPGALPGVHQVFHEWCTRASIS